jgi:hypothetical protein
MGHCKNSRPLCFRLRRTPTRRRKPGWATANQSLAQLTIDLKKFTAANATHDIKASFEAAYAKMNPQVEEALAIPQAELAAPLKPAQPLVSTARDAVEAAITEVDWPKAQISLGQLKTKLNTLIQGKRDQDLARRK